MPFANAAVSAFVRTELPTTHASLVPPRVRAKEMAFLPGGRRHVTEISTPRWRRTRHEGVVVHETRAWCPDDVDVSDVPVTLPARTLIDAAAVLQAILIADVRRKTAPEYGNTPNL